MNLLSHTPPAHYAVGSLEQQMKRPRSGSISTRLRSASVLCEESNVDKETKGALKDLIIRDDPSMRPLMQRIEDGDKAVLREMIQDGTLKAAAAAAATSDLMGVDGDLNLEFLNVGGDLGSMGSGHNLFMDPAPREGGVHNQGDDDDDVGAGGQFEFTFNDDADDDTFPTNLPGSSSSSSSGMRARHRDGAGDTAPRTLLHQSDVKPIPVKAEPSTGSTGSNGDGSANRDRAISFGQPLMEMFGIDMFDDPNAPPVSYSPMSHSPPQSMGSVGSAAVAAAAAVAGGLRTTTSEASIGSTSNILHRPLHRDSISCVDDIRAVSYGSGAFDEGFNEGDSVTGTSDAGRERLSSLASLSSLSAGLTLPAPGGSAGSFGGSRAARTRPGGIAHVNGPPPGHRPTTRTRTGARAPRSARAMLQGAAYNEPSAAAGASSQALPNHATGGAPGASGRGRAKPKARRDGGTQALPQHSHQGTHQSGRGPQQGGRQGQQHQNSRGQHPPLAPKAKASAPVPISQPARPAFVYKHDPAQVNQSGYIGNYSPDSRRRRLDKFLQKRQNRVWMKRVSYGVRKDFADSRLRVKGRFVRKEDEALLREMVAMTL